MQVQEFKVMELECANAMETRRIIGVVPIGGAICRISGFGRPLRFELWGAREDYALYLSVSQGSKLLEEQHKRHRVYTSSGHHCGVIPYSSLWWVDCFLG